MDDSFDELAAELTGDDLDMLLAGADIVGRMGAREFEVGFADEHAPVVQLAGWYAAAKWQGTRVSVDGHDSAGAAADALARQLLDGVCKCGRRATAGSQKGRCWWRRDGQRWESGCQAEPFYVPGMRGDLNAMAAVVNERFSGSRRERRGNRERGPRRRNS